VVGERARKNEKYMGLLKRCGYFFAEMLDICGGKKAKTIDLCRGGKQSEKKRKMKTFGRDILIFFKKVLVFGLV